MHAITRSCVLFLWMHTLTFVKSQDCTLEQFVKSNLYDSNFDTTDLEASYPGGRSVRVGCNVGYSGFFRLICVEGKWEPRGNKCQPRSCGHPGDAPFSDFHLEKGDDFVFGSQVVYTCHKGYQMVSRTNYRRCMAEGWDGVVPVCEAQRCPVIHVDNNVQVNGDPEEATYGNVVRFSCKSSSEILYGSTEIYCDENGDWSAAAPKCKEVKCALPVIQNGYVPGDIQEYKEHDVLHFACDPQYKAAELRPSKCTKLGTSADWSPTPVCEPIRCRLAQTTLEGTRYEPAYKNVFSPGETLRVTCGEKYWVLNHRTTSAVASCDADGEWTVRPICQEVICPNPRDRHVTSWYDGWRQQSKLGDTASYQCTYGYKRPDGFTRATCTRDGWSPNPLCEELTCDRQDIPNANIVTDNKQKYKYNERASYVCKDGYQGRFTLTCTERGWTGSPQCTEITCSRQNIPNANIVGDKKPKYKYNEEVHYVCKDGYQGRFTVTCTERGWTENPQCTAIKCGRKLYQYADIDGTVRSEYGYEAQVKYICKKPLEGSFTLTCGEAGWTGSPQCSECPKASLQHGFIVGPYNKTVYYSCDEGYKLVSKGWWDKAVCKDGLWSGLEQCIEKTMCGKPVIPNGEVKPQLNAYENNKRFQITCKEGFQARDTITTCQEGKWRFSGPLKNICRPIASHCKPPPKVENAVVATSYQKEFLSDSRVTYRCRDNYTMEGEDTIQCKDGNWEEKDIQCRPTTQEQ